MISEIQQLLERYFPERQVYHRSGGTIRYFNISSIQQIVLTVASASLVAWSIFASLSLLFDATLETDRSQQLIAKYERWIDDYRSRDELAEEHLFEVKSAYEAKIQNMLVLDEQLGPDERLNIQRIVDHNLTLTQDIERLRREIDSLDPENLRKSNNYLAIEQSQRRIQELETQRASLQAELDQMRARFDATALPEPDFFMRQIVSLKNYIKATWLQMDPSSSMSDSDYAQLTFNLVAVFLLPLGWFTVFALNRLLFAIWTSKH